MRRAGRSRWRGWTTGLTVVLLLLATGAGPGSPGARAVAPPRTPSGPAGLAVEPYPWTNLTSPIGPHPPVAAGDALVNDSADGYDLWFGGQAGTIGQTWTYSNGTWTNRTPDLPRSPPARSFAAMVYDPSASAAVLFGGLGDPSYLNDTWVWEGGTWTNLTTFVGAAPSPRAEASAAFDPAFGGLLLYGGIGSSGALADTWSFSGDHWTLLAPSTAPGPACCGAMAFDGSSDSAVLVLPNATPSGSLTTWAYAAGDWTNLSPPTAPSSRYWPSLVEDPATDGLLLFGGSSLARPPYWPLGDAWLFANGSWTAAAGAGSGVAPSPRWGAAITPTVPSNTTTSCFLLAGGAGSNGASQSSDAFWQGCGDRAAWVRSSGGTGGGGTPPTLTLEASPLRGSVPFNATVEATVVGGTAPYNLTVCVSTGNCSEASPWSGASAYSQQVPVTTPGIVSVSAFVADANGLTSSATLELDGIASPPLNVSPAVSPTEGPGPLTVGFRADVSGGVPPYEVQWYFGDGATAAGTPNVTLTHVYESAGTYYPHLVVTDAYGHSLPIALASVVVVAPPPNHSGSGRILGLTSDEIAGGILLFGILGAAGVYVVRRRGVLRQVDRTMAEVRGGAPEGPPEERRGR